jgi:PPOX class probable F420-dependent enzyme
MSESEAEHAFYTEEERSFLGGHRWAVLATGRADGSPQQAMVGYTLDREGRVLVSTQRTTAKWRNAARRPKVALAVPDGRVHLVVYGMAEEIVDDPERAELSADVLAVVRGPNRPDPSEIIGWLDSQQRGVLRITPQKVLMHD